MAEITQKSTKITQWATCWCRHCQCKPQAEPEGPSHGQDRLRSHTELLVRRCQCQWRLTRILKHTSSELPPHASDSWLAQWWSSVTGTPSAAEIRLSESESCRSRRRRANAVLEGPNRDEGGSGRRGAAVRAMDPSSSSCQWSWGDSL